MYGREKRWVDLRERDHPEDPIVDGRIIYFLVYNLDQPM
jgi:hypothetical protein